MIEISLFLSHFFFPARDERGEGIQRPSITSKGRSGHFSGRSTLPGLFRSQSMEQSSLLQIQKLAHRVLFSLLRLLPPAILYPRKCPQFRLVSKQHDFADDVAVPHSDGLSMYFRHFTGNVYNGKEKTDSQASIAIVQLLRLIPTPTDFKGLTNPGMYIVL